MKLLDHVQHFHRLNDDDIRLDVAQLPPQLLRLLLIRINLFIIIIIPMFLVVVIVVAAVVVFLVSAAAADDFLFIDVLLKESNFCLFT